MNFFSRLLLCGSILLWGGVSIYAMVGAFGEGQPAKSEGMAPAAGTPEETRARLQQPAPSVPTAGVVARVPGAPSSGFYTDMAAQALRDIKEDTSSEFIDAKTKALGDFRSAWDAALQGLTDDEKQEHFSDSPKDIYSGAINGSSDSSELKSTFNAAMGYVKTALDLIAVSRQRAKKVVQAPAPEVVPAAGPAPEATSAVTPEERELEREFREGEAEQEVAEEPVVAPAPELVVAPTGPVAAPSAAPEGKHRVKKPIKFKSAAEAARYGAIVGKPLAFEYQEKHKRPEKKVVAPVAGESKRIKQRAKTKKAQEKREFGRPGEPRVEGVGEMMLEPVEIPAPTVALEAGQAAAPAAARKTLAEAKEEALAGFNEILGGLNVFAPASRDEIKLRVTDAIEAVRQAKTSEEVAGAVENMESVLTTLAQRETERIRKEETEPAAATKIQAAWRGHRTRKELLKKALVEQLSLLLQPERTALLDEPVRGQVVELINRARREIERARDTAAVRRAQRDLEQNIGRIMAASKIQGAWRQYQNRVAKNIAEMEQLDLKYERQKEAEELVAQVPPEEIVSGPLVSEAAPAAGLDLAATKKQALERIDELAAQNESNDLLVRKLRRAGKEVLSATTFDQVKSLRAKAEKLAAAAEKAVPAPVEGPAQMSGPGVAPVEPVAPEAMVVPHRAGEVAAVPSTQSIRQANDQLNELMRITGARDQRQLLLRLHPDKATLTPGLLQFLNERVGAVGAPVEALSPEQRLKALNDLYSYAQNLRAVSQGQPVRAVAGAAPAAIEAPAPGAGPVAVPVAAGRVGELEVAHGATQAQAREQQLRKELAEQRKRAAQLKFKGLAKRGLEAERQKVARGELLKKAGEEKQLRMAAEQRVAGLRQRVADLELFLKTAETRIGILNATLDAVVIQRDYALARVEALDKHLAEAEKRLEETRKTDAENKARIAGLKQLVDDLSAELRGAKDQLVQAEAEIARLNAERGQTKKALADSQDQVNVLEGALSDAMRQLTDEQQRRLRAEQQTEMLGREVVRLAEHVRGLEGEVHHLEGLLAGAEKERDDAQAQAKTFRDRLIAKQQELEAAKARIQRDDAEIRQLTGEVEDLELRLGIAESLLTYAQAEVRRLQGDLDRMHQDLNQANVQIKQVTEQRDEARDRLRQAQERAQMAGQDVGVAPAPAPVVIAVPPVVPAPAPAPAPAAVRAAQKKKGKRRGKKTPKRTKKTGRRGAGKKKSTKKGTPPITRKFAAK